MRIRIGDMAASGNRKVDFVCDYCGEAITSVEDGYAVDTDRISQLAREHADVHARQSAFAQELAVKVLETY